MQPGGGNPGGGGMEAVGGRKEVRAQAGRLVTSRLRVQPLWVSELRGLAEEGYVHAQR